MFRGTRAWPKRTVVICLLMGVWLLGVFGTSTYSAPALCVSIGVGVVLVLALLLYRRVLVAFLCGVIGLSSCVVVLSEQREMADRAARLQQVSLFEGVVIQPVERGREELRFVVRTPCGLSESEERACDVLVTASRFSSVVYGDRLRVSGDVEVPTSDGTFRYDRYLAVSGISHVVRASHIQRIDSEPPSVLLGGLYRTRLFLEQRIGQLFPEPEASFLAGLLLGVRSGMPDSVLEAFADTGMTHIVALSGANITLVGTIVFRLLSGPVSRRIAFVFTLLGIFVFVVATGASSSVVRAGIMGALAFTARECGRPLTWLATLALLLVSAVLMTCWRPLALVWDAGFQLSFAATFGVVYVSTRIEKWFRWVPSVFTLRESVVLSVASQMTTAPLLLWHFGTISAVAPLANLFVLPVLPWAMLFGALSIGCSSFLPGIAVHFGAVSVGLLRWALWVVEQLAAL
ncbi:MAG: ComEC/Rec2 family competence protein [Candidatus Doudnabacteria bacterium]|nr:ComEC/Rec2 family competence protein [Candidatus Doudnabacteria bacterium]